VEKVQLEGGRKGQTKKTKKNQAMGGKQKWEKVVSLESRGEKPKAQEWEVNEKGGRGGGFWKMKGNKLIQTGKKMKKHKKLGQTSTRADTKGIPRSSKNASGTTENIKIGKEKRRGNGPERKKIQVSWFGGGKERLLKRRKV